MLHKFNQLKGITKFNLLWNAGFFLLEAFFAVTLHSMFAVVFVFAFAAFFLMTVKTAQWELEDIKLEEAARAAYQEYLNSWPSDKH